MSLRILLRLRSILLVCAAVCAAVILLGQCVRSMPARPGLISTDSPKNHGTVPSQDKGGTPKQLGWEIVNTFSHPPNSFTQGLVYEDGFLYEGTGQYGGSSIRKIDLKTGKILKKADLDSTLFGEGITIFKDKIFQLTWYSRVAFVYDKESFKLLKSFPYPIRTEGWGLTTDGVNLIMSDGSSSLYYLDPKSFKLKKQVRVTMKNSPVYEINELEFIKGSIYANVWQTEFIIRIDPETGRVTGIILLKGLTPPQYRNHADNVLNGIAYNPDTGHLYITGKMWPKIYEIKLTDRH